MKTLLTIVLTCCYLLGLAQTNKTTTDSTVLKKPIEYNGHFDINGLTLLQKFPTPNRLSFDVKYWLGKEKWLRKNVGFGWQTGNKWLYAYSKDPFHIESIEEPKTNLSYSYHYVSGRIRLQTKGRVIRPYVEVGTGWLLVTDKASKSEPNPNYDPDHICPEGSPRTISVETPLKMQHRLGADIEGGFNIGVNEKLRINIGVGYLQTHHLNYLEETAIAPTYENLQLKNSSQHYQWKKRNAHSLSLKVGISVLLFNDPNIIRSPSSFDDEDDFGGGGGGCGSN